MINTVFFSLVLRKLQSSWEAAVYLGLLDTGWDRVVTGNNGAEAFIIQST